jgi:transmembrane sensor
VIATGTLFNVDMLDRHLFVTLLRGSVVVAKEAAAPTDEEIPLKPSERLIVERATGAVQKIRIDAVDADAWARGKLVFEVEPLDQAVARVNRYARRKIVLEAPKQATQPISGVFNVGDVDAFAEAVSAQLPLRSELNGDAVDLVPR